MPLNKPYLPEKYILSTKRLGLRRWLPSDHAPFARMNKDIRVMEYFPKTLTDEESMQMIERINAHVEKHGFGLYAIEKLATNTFIGYTGFMIPAFDSFFTPCVEIGWRIMAAEWNNGYATEAAKACLHHGFGNLGFTKIYSFTSVENTRSQRVMQKTGMLKAGEFNHPGIPAGSLLCRHVLYCIEKNTPG